MPWQAKLATKVPPNLIDVTADTLQFVILANGAGSRSDRSAAFERRVETRQLMKSVSSIWNRSRIHVSLTLSGTAGIAAIFLPFTYGVSPVDAALQKELSLFRLLAIPFFVGIIVSGASIRWIISGAFSRAEKAIAYLVSVATAAMPLTFLGLLVGEQGWPPDSRDWLTSAIPLVALLLGVYPLIRNLKNQTTVEYSPVMAMQLAYLANCLFCLDVFRDDWEVGAYLAIVTALAYLIQISLFSWERGTGEKR